MNTHIICIPKVHRHPHVHNILLLYFHTNTTTHLKIIGLFTQYQTCPSHKEPTSKTNTWYPSRSVGLLVARETGCSQNQSPAWKGKLPYCFQQPLAALRKAGQIIPIPLMTNNVDHSPWLQRGLVTWSEMLCNAVFCCGMFLSELRESGPQRGHAASTKLIINMSNGLLREATEPQGRCDKWQIRESTEWSLISPLFILSAAAAFTRQQTQWHLTSHGMPDEQRIHNRSNPAPLSLKNKKWMKKQMEGGIRRMERGDRERRKKKLRRTWKV